MLQKLYWSPLILLMTVTLSLVLANIARSNESEVRDVSPELIETSSHNERIYRNPQERREAGLGIEITDWLKVSLLAELEREQAKKYFNDNLDETVKESLTKTVQLSFQAEITNFLEAELVLEAEKTDHTRSKVDEALVTLDLDEWGITIGHLFVPFGEYYSHFVVGPLLEFGETKSTAMIVDYSVSENFELAAFVMQSDVDKIRVDESVDWGLAFAWKSEDEAIRLGSSYLSDLAESDEGFVHDNNDSYRQRVAALSAYVLIGWGSYELTTEMVQALDSFAELETEIDKPAAYNMELAFFPRHNLQLAARYEQSREFEDAPEDQYGLSVTWLPTRFINLSLDYLRGNFKSGFVEDDDGNVLKKQDIFAWQLSVVF